MSLETLRQRYLHIAKYSLAFLKEKGFKKKGSKYFQDKGELVLEISSRIPRPWSNSENCYEFQIDWEVMTTNQKFLELYMFMEGEKNIKKAPLIGLVILPDTYKWGTSFLTKDDPPGYEDQFVVGIKNKIEQELIPWFNHINSIDDIMQIAEEESKIERNKRIFFRETSIYKNIANFYAARGQKDRALEACEKYIGSTPATARELAEKRKKKYIQYFDQFKE